MKATSVCSKWVQRTVKGLGLMQHLKPTHRQPPQCTLSTQRPTLLHVLHMLMSRCCEPCPRGA
jgi:hypothetical protein